MEIGEEKGFYSPHELAQNETKLAKNILPMSTIKKNTEKKKEYFHFFQTWSLYFFYKSYYTKIPAEIV